MRYEVVIPVPKSVPFKMGLQAKDKDDLAKRLKILGFQNWKLKEDLQNVKS